MQPKKRDRGDHRVLYTSILQDEEFHSLSVLAKWLFIELKLRLGPSGIGLVRVGVLAESVSCETAEIEVALDELVRPKEGNEHGWIIREGTAIWIVRGLHFEASLTPNNDKHWKPIRHAVKALGDRPIASRYREYYREWFTGSTPNSSDTVSDTVSGTVSRTPSRPYRMVRSTVGNHENGNEDSDANNQKTNSPRSGAGGSNGEKGKAFHILSGIRKKRVSSITGNGTHYHIPKDAVAALSPRAHAALDVVGGPSVIANANDQAWRVLLSHFATAFEAGPDARE